MSTPYFTEGNGCIVFFAGVLNFVLGVSKLKAPKFGIEKKLKHYWWEATFFESLYVVKLCSSSNPGLISVQGGLWAPTAPQPMNQTECLVPLLKSMIYECFEPKGEKYGCILNVRCTASKHPYFT